MQLVSKMRFIAAQFNAFFTDDLWLQNARHANEMAQLLARELAGIDEIDLDIPYKLMQYLLALKEGT